MESVSILNFGKGLPSKFGSDISLWNLWPEAEEVCPGQIPNPGLVFAVVMVEVVEHGQCHIVQKSKRQERKTKEKEAVWAFLCYCVDEGCGLFSVTWAAVPYTLRIYML